MENKSYVSVSVVKDNDETFEVKVLVNVSVNVVASFLSCEDVKSVTVRK